MKCNECGTRLEEYSDDPNAYVVDETRCPGCEKLAYAQHDWAEEGTGAYGVKFRLVKPDSLPPTRMPS